jgi:hypothetical protein
LRPRGRAIRGLQAPRAASGSQSSIREHRYIPGLSVFLTTMSAARRRGTRHLAAAIAATLACALALPALAAATLIEVGAKARTTAPSTPSCPTNPCLAVSRTTGFQVSVGSLTGPLALPSAGRLVAWTITLSKPSATQIKYFNEHEGGAASAGIAILRPEHSRSKKSSISAKKPAKKQPTNTTPTGYTLVAQSPVVPLEPYFGETAQFPLEKTIEVKKGDIVALTVPTWAPALTLGFGKTTGWRASRPATKKGCEETSVQTTQTKIGSNAPYACQYHEARLTYSATLIATP